MSWRDFQDSIPKDKTDKRDKSPECDAQSTPFVPFIPFVLGGGNQKKQEEIADPFLAGHHVLVHLEPVGDVWLVCDEQATGSLHPEGLPVLFGRDVRWILQAQGHEARLERLKVILGKRHHLTQVVLGIFPGSRINSIKEVMS